MHDKPWQYGVNLTMHLQEHKASYVYISLWISWRPKPEYSKKFNKCFFTPGNVSQFTPSRWEMTNQKVDNLMGLSHVYQVPGLTVIFFSGGEQEAIDHHTSGPGRGVGGGSRWGGGGDRPAEVFTGRILGKFSRLFPTFLKLFLIFLHTLPYSTVYIGSYLFSTYIPHSAIFLHTLPYSTV